MSKLRAIFFDHEITQRKRNQQRKKNVSIRFAYLAHAEGHGALRCELIANSERFETNRKLSVSHRSLIIFS